MNLRRIGDQMIRGNILVMAADNGGVGGRKSTQISSERMRMLGTPGEVTGKPL